jgi:hypothetical protein
MVVWDPIDLVRAPVGLFSIGSKMAARDVPILVDGLPLPLR